MPNYKDILERFKDLEDLEDKYEELVQLGSEFSYIFDTSIIKDDNLVEGCSSRVWLEIVFKNNFVEIKINGEGLIVKGLLVIIYSFFNNQKVDFVIQKGPEFLNDIGLKNFLTPNRANGVISIVKEIKLRTISNHSSKIY